MVNEEFSYDFIKNINESLYRRFDDFIRVCLASKDSNYIFISSTGSLFELAFKQFLYSKNKLFEFFNYEDPNLFEMISGDSLKYLLSFFNVDFDIIHKYRIESNSSRHDLFPIVPSFDKIEIVKTLFDVYVTLNNELTCNKVDRPTKDYIKQLCSFQNDVIKELETKSKELIQIESDIKDKEDKISKFNRIIDTKETKSKELINEIIKLDNLIEKRKNEVQVETISSSNEIRNRGYKKLIEKDFVRAELLFENSIKQNVVDYESYIGYFLAVNKVTNIDELLLKPVVDIINTGLYQQAVDILSDADKDSMVEIGNKVHLQYLYSTALNLFEEKSFQSAKQLFELLGDYKDSLIRITTCEKGLKYIEAKDLFYCGKYKEAFSSFEKIIPFLDADYFLELSKEAMRKEASKDSILEKQRLYMKADYLVSQLMFDEAICIYEKLSDYRKIEETQKYKKMFGLFTKFLNGETGGEELLSINENDEIFIEVSRYFPGCFIERKESLLKEYAKKWEQIKTKNIVLMIKSIEESINKYERNIAVEALFSVVFNRPYIELEEQLKVFLKDEKLKNKYFNQMMNEYKNSEYESRVIEEEIDWVWVFLQTMTK